MAKPASRNRGTQKNQGSQGTTLKQPQIRTLQSIQQRLEWCTNALNTMFRAWGGSSSQQASRRPAGKAKTMAAGQTQQQ